MGRLSASLLAYCLLICRLFTCYVLPPPAYLLYATYYCSYYYLNIPNRMNRIHHLFFTDEKKNLFTFH